MSNAIQSIASAILMLLGFVAVIALTYFATKLIGKKYSGSTLGSGYVKVIDKIVLGQDKMLLVVKSAGKTLLIGATAHSINNICELDEEKLEKYSPDSNAEPFSDILQGFLTNKKVPFKKDLFVKKKDEEDSGNGNKL